MWLNGEVVRDVARSVLAYTSQRLVAVYRPAQRTSHNTPTKLSVLVDLQTSASYKHTWFSVLFKWAPGGPQRTLVATKREEDKKKNDGNFLFQNNPYRSLRHETPLTLQPTHHWTSDCSFAKKGLKLTEEKCGGYDAESLLISNFLEYQVKLSTKLCGK